LINLIYLSLIISPLKVHFLLTSNNRGISKAKLEDYRGSIQDYTKSIELEPTAYAYHGRGLSKIILGDIDGGCLDLSKAGELGDETAYDTIRDLCN